MRMLSEDFMNDLSCSNGLLFPFLKRVKHDNTLMLAIRQDYINIYYRGGNIVRVSKLPNGSYSAFFDNKYNGPNTESQDLPDTIESQDSSERWVNAFQGLKGIMDVYFSKYKKPEREFQQLVARENNISTISNQSEYFISDIEFASSELGRFDMLAIRWLASQRKNPSNCRPVLIEMKYGDGSLGGNAGVLKHLQDFDILISDGIKFRKLLDTIENQFSQLDQLGLMTFNKIDKWKNIKFNPDVKPEVILLLANHNPRSPKLKTILDDSQIELYAHSDKFDLRFFVASFAGYALHADCMVTLDQFRELLKDKDDSSAKRIRQKMSRLNPTRLAESLI